MSEPRPQAAGRAKRRSGARPARDEAAAEAVRSTAERASDHARIDRLADELLPALMAKLGATQLGEIEVREEGWKVRLRRPADGDPGGTNPGRRATDRVPRAHPGHAGHGHAPAAVEGHRPVAPPALSVAAAGYSGNGSASAAPMPVGPGRPDAAGTGGRLLEPHRVMATSPAVGIYQPRPEARSGSRVRAGDRLGAIDMLGLPQEVVAPADGIVGASLVEPGEAVEYGQELVAIELIGSHAGLADPLAPGGGEG